MTTRVEGAGKTRRLLVTTKREYDRLIKLFPLVEVVLVKKIKKTIAQDGLWSEGENKNDGPTNPRNRTTNPN